MIFIIFLQDCNYTLGIYRSGNGEEESHNTDTFLVLWTDVTGDDDDIKMTINEKTYENGTFTNNCSVTFWNTGTINGSGYALPVTLTVIQMSNSSQIGISEDHVFYRFKMENEGDNSDLVIFKKVNKPVNGKRRRKGLQVGYLHYSSKQPVLTFKNSINILF